jgi:hypothetical protein
MALQEGDVDKTNYLLYPSAMAASCSLLIVAYALADQPFSYVLKHANASVIQVFTIY